MLYKVWGVRKIVLLTMLEHQDSAILQQVLLENQSRDGGQFLEGVRGIGKNKIKLLFARFDIAEHIATDTLNILALQASGAGAEH